MADEKTVVPLKHVVVLPDGDRRWAKEHGLAPWEGHKKGAENIRNVIEACKEKNIKYLTFWGFSTENWHRDPTEVKELMHIFKEMIRLYKKEFIKQKVRFRQIGRRDRFDAELHKAILDLEDATKDFTDWYLQVALDYGGRDEIVRAIQKFAQKCVAGEANPSDLTTDSFSSYLDTYDIPDPDLIVRTSGEQRLSGILPYQGVYAELVFAQVNFPDMTKERFIEIIDQYYNRQRRFGAG